MTIAPDLVAQILRLHTVEKWRVGTRLRTPEIAITGRIRRRASG